LKCIQFLLAHLPFQTHLNFELMHLADSDSHRIYSPMNTGNRWWDTQDQLPAGGTILPVICASDKTHSSNFLGYQHAYTVDITIGNVCTDIRRSPKKRTWILFELIPCPQKGAKNIDDAWHSAVGTVLPQPRHLDITGPGLKWDCADGFQ